MPRWRGTTTQRGYGHCDHQQPRQTYLATFTPGQPCARCGQPMHNWPHIRNDRGVYTCDQCDLGHIDGTSKQAYAGLEHRSCNRAAGARLKNRRKTVPTPRITRPWRPSAQWSPSRDW